MIVSFLPSKTLWVFNFLIFLSLFVFWNVHISLLDCKYISPFSFYCCYYKVVFFLAIMTPNNVVLFFSLLNCFSQVERWWFSAIKKNHIVFIECLLSEYTFITFITVANNINKKVFTLGWKNIIDILQCLTTSSSRFILLIHTRYHWYVSKTLGWELCRSDA